MSIPQFHPETQAEWRAWLKENHLKEKKVGLIHNKKHTGKRAMSAQEAMDEAICFGWIDTTVKRLDEDRYLQYFARRTNKSRWSNNTLAHAKRLIKAGKMTPEGLRRYKEGLKKPVLGAGIPHFPDVPPELEKALAKSRKAKEFFHAMPPSARRMYLRWVVSAKLPETKAKRVKIIYDACKQGIRPGFSANSQKNS